MGFRFRRSVGILPGIRLNFSKSGASVSLGRRGFWYTIGSKGTRATVGIPGTGLSWTEYSPYQSRNAPSSQENAPRTKGDQFAGDDVIDSAPLAAIVAKSTSDLVPLLQLMNSRWRFSRVLAIFSVLVFGCGIFFGNHEWTILALLGAVGFPLAKLTDHHRRTLKVTYDLGEDDKSRFGEILGSFETLRQSKRTWHIPTQQFTSDWKRNAGATTIVKRHRIYPNLRRPVGMRSNVKFPSIEVGSQVIQFGPDCVLISSSSDVVALSYADFEIRGSLTSFVEHQTVASDAIVSGQTWLYANKNGGPDRRFVNNKELPLCSYTEINFDSEGGLSERIMLSSPSAIQFAPTIEEIGRLQASGEEQKLTTVVELPRKKWPAIAIAVYGLILALCTGIVTAGDKKLQSAVVRFVANPSGVKSSTSETKLDVQLPQTPIVSTPPTKVQPQKRKAPVDDPWRIVR